MKFKIVFIFSLIAIIISSFEVQQKSDDISFRQDKFQMKKLSYFERFHSFTYAVPLVTPAVCDDKGIEMVLYDGIKQYNPGALSIQGLRYINSFKIKPDSNYLRRVELYANKLVEIAVEEHGSLFFKYDFNFKLHGGADEMKKPWFSGMDQGTVLSFFCSCYEMTKDKKYLDLAGKTFKSLTLIQKGNIKVPSRCVSRVDSAGYLWFEEYPFNPSAITLNGFLFTIIGIYDYYLLKPNDPVVYKYLTGALTTAKDNILLFRVPGDYSYYCLKHKIQYANYHKYHIMLLNYLALFSNEGMFKEAATLFEIDKKN